MTKYIFVTGGVVSSLGKGLTCGAIGFLLESRGLRVAMQKLDPYVNVDPGTMSPYQHGEVYVTDDGAETDLDLGHYERFTNAVLTRASNCTTGKVYLSVIEKERRGEYLGKTVQIVPHITNEIKDAITRCAGKGVDVLICEIGGTVGDIEGLPFLEAVRQFSLEAGRGNVLHIHLTLLPYLRASGEMKTKPTQHSVGKLREIGIQPDVLICRCEKAMNEELKSKIGMFCNVPPSAVFEEKDVDFSIYEVPLVLARQGLDELIVKHLGLKTRPAQLGPWREMVDSIRKPARSVEIALVGKYIELQDAYKSILESLAHGGIANHAKVVIRKIRAEDLEEKDAQSLLAGVHGILVPGGFGMRGIEGKVKAVKYARENMIPFFGICLGMQCAAVEIARSICGLARANSTEFDEKTPAPVICLMDAQRKVTRKGGTMRLGAYPCKLAAGSKAREAYGAAVVQERHRHRYEFNKDYRKRFEMRGVLFSGLSPDGKLAEIIELRRHPWFVAVQFHPEFKSKPVAAHPLFRSFVAAALEKSGQVSVAPAADGKARRAVRKGE